MRARSSYSPFTLAVYVTMYVLLYGALTSPGTRGTLCAPPRPSIVLSSLREAFTAHGTRATSRVVLPITVFMHIHMYITKTCEMSTCAQHELSSTCIAALRVHVLAGVPVTVAVSCVV